MNKKQLIAQLSGSLNLSKADAERTFDTITNTILDASVPALIANKTSSIDAASSPNPRDTMF